MSKKLILITVLLGLLAISTVSAADNTESDIIGADGLNSTSNIPMDAPRTFTQLNEAITPYTSIDLEHDYRYDNETDSEFANGVPITKNITIDGKGHTLDGNYLARIFIIKEDCTAVFKNINFINGKASTNGGAIYGVCNAENCNFLNNTAVKDGGAIHLSNADNCNFINNYVLNGRGGAMYKGYATNCIFTDNSAVTGGALFENSATKCKFTNNFAKENGGALYGGFAVQCNFNKNSAKNNGGALYKGSAHYCNFSDNYAVNHGGGMYGGAGEYCFFKNNAAKSGHDAYRSSLKKTKTTIYIKPTTTAHYGDYVVITLKNIKNKVVSGVKVSVFINGKKYATKITNKYGQIKIDTRNGFVIKKYTIKSKFAEDSNYYASSKTVKITIKKSTPKITANSKTFKKSTKIKKYSITLKTKQGKIMKNKKITLNVNHRYYYATTNYKGIATFKITKLLYKGKFTATTGYAGSKYYNALTKKSTIIVR
ncbi:right-handed parallel beta-helix repeat-containing protein [Methanobrevibacter gottschalkii]|uniref:hypothetical protein n=1 Tax=Methanobrevibacter gottschalkii TaxID=190974 RepID=UPI0038D22439